MKTCTRCGIAKPIAAFATRRKERGTLQSWCRDCHRAYAAERYERFTPEQRARKNRAARERQRQLRGRVWAHLASQRCADCGESDVLVLEFDHRGGKRACVADMVSNSAPWDEIQAEIAKCEVRCANCHRRQTAARRMTAPKVLVKVPATRGRIELPHADSKSAALSTELPGLAKDDDNERLACERCRRELPASEFAWRWTARGIRQRWCRSCHNAQKRRHYALNRARESARTSARRLLLLSENAPRLRRYLEEHPCVDCGESDPAILEFDHLRDKRADVTRMLWSGMLWSQIELEIAKCEVRCANCHRRRTARQRGFHDRKKGVSEDTVRYGGPGERQRPRTESNRRLRFRRPMLYPLSYGVIV